MLEETNQIGLLFRHGVGCVLGSSKELLRLTLVPTPLSSVVRMRALMIKRWRFCRQCRHLPSLGWSNILFIWLMLSWLYCVPHRYANRAFPIAGATCLWQEAVYHLHQALHAYIKNLTAKLEPEKAEEFKKGIEGATKYLLGKLKDLRL